MTAGLTSGELSNSTNTTTVMQGYLEQLNAFLNESTSGCVAESTLTPASGTITALVEGGNTFSVDNSGGGAFNLTHISTTMSDTSAFPDGREIWIRAGNPATDPMTIVSGAGGTGQIITSDGANVTFNSTKQWMLLKRTGSNFEEKGRFYGDQKTAFLAWLGAYAFTNNGSPVSTGKRYTSAAGLTLSAAASLTVGPHNLGAAPTKVWLVATCATNDSSSGYSAGDIMILYPNSPNAVTGLPAISARVDTTNVYITTNSSANGICFTARAGGASVGKINLSDWTFQVFAEL